MLRFRVASEDVQDCGSVIPKHIAGRKAVQIGVEQPGIVELAPGAPAAKSSRTTYFVLFVQGATLITFVLLRVILIKYVPLESLIYPTCVGIVLLSIWSLWSWRALTNSLSNPYVLFLLAGMLFNAGQAFLEVFGLNEGGILKNTFSSQTLLDTLFLVLLGLGTLHLGALIGVVSSRPPVKRTNPAIPVAPQHIQTVAWILLAISFVPAVLLLRDATDVVQAGGYHALYQREVNTGIDASPNILATFFVPGALFLLAGSSKRKMIIAVSSICVLAYSIIQIMLGYRGWGILPLISFGWLWNRVVHPVPKAAILTVGLVVLFIVFPLIGVTRNTTGEQRWSTSYLADALNSIKSPAVASLSELGGTMGVIAYTLNLVPDQRNFDMGVDYFYAATTVLPNFFWSVHPAVAYGLPSHWLVWTVAPYTAQQGGGLGYSFIAEGYLNFGWIGAPIVFMLIGFGLVKLGNWADKPDEPARSAMLATYLSFLLYFARSEAATIARPFFWYSLFPYLLILLVAEVSRKLSGKSGPTRLANHGPN